MGCLDLNPWAVRSADVDHPDELRVDLDPQPGRPFDAVRQVAMSAHEVLSEHGYDSYPKDVWARAAFTSTFGSRAEWDFLEVRRARLPLVVRSNVVCPPVATTKWWKEERGDKVFIDYNQNARDRTVASVYSVRANAMGKVSAPLLWDEVPDVEPEDLTIATVPARYTERGDLGAGIDTKAFSLQPLLDLADRDERNGLGDAPWPPNFAKQKGEPKRVQPSRAKKTVVKQRLLSTLTEQRPRVASRCSFVELGRDANF